ncbi:hypothetical protein [Vulgatibacter incomptus]|uniref:Uncharacterized protein n=1 Tax=Vulgatibacter incomptus TaxID=1391653 RepID=A0A0K1P8G0_9BACT|nr:hypothetical protein [Vulgatibacter incomptus]AKU89805.1 hypothetical protein AKJ08_0192 [Vulgatibacter incomptus]
MSDRFFPKTSPGVRGLQYHEPLIFERSEPGRMGVSLPEAGVPESDPATELPPSSCAARSSTSPR